MSGRWIDLLDPTREELVGALPSGVDPDVVEVLATRTGGIREPRPFLEGHGSYVVGAFFDALPNGADGRISYREVAVVATPDLLVTVRKSSPECGPWHAEPLEGPASEGASVGELLFRVVDDVAESFLDVVDSADTGIDTLEDHIEDWPSNQVRRELGALRHDLLHARRTVGATRAAVRKIVDKRLDIGTEKLFPEPVERMFADTYETLFRAGEDLDVARDLLSSSRDYHQSVIAERQNDIVKTLTVIASLVLVPSLIVGFYGQNFEGEFSRPFWTFGVSLGLILGSTVLQLAIFRWRRWI
ncbi:MAG TPA: magnesium transporter CorA family protein [Gaiellaceae bacterium]|nr:magnesium transporter CorA family protein [Gaiellaceae bacterium]